MEKELIKQVFDYLIKMVEINETIKNKTNAVKDQNFALASELRSSELLLIESLPSLESMKEIRNSL